MTGNGPPHNQGKKAPEIKVHEKSTLAKEWRQIAEPEDQTHLHYELQTATQLRYRDAKVTLGHSLTGMLRPHVKHTIHVETEEQSQVCCPKARATEEQE